MFFFNFLYYFFLTFVISSSYYIHHVLALSKESIIAGYLGEHKFFKYQAVIYGVANFTLVNDVIGGGAIIHNYFIISAAQNFINSTHHFKELTYSVGIGTDKLGRGSGYVVNADCIFLPFYDPVTTLNDIALIRTDQAMLMTKYRLRLNKLKLPKSVQPLAGAVGLVSGFGAVRVKLAFDIEGQLQRYTAIDNKLHFAAVEIMKDEECLFKYSDVTLDKQICGRTYSIEADDRTGICDDIGNPLVINGTLEGLASRNNLDCNDTINGCVYTKVSAYLGFIYMILEGGLPPNTFVFQNRPHIPPPRLQRV